jgi:hypothetical protein
VASGTWSAAIRAPRTHRRLLPIGASYFAALVKQELLLDAERQPSA